MVGKTIGHYEVLDQLGAGGMGIVYRARDTRLDREVAIKALPDPVAEDSERLARFEREARLLAAVNHRHIGAIYGLERHAGRQFLVLELVAGETLAERIGRGPVPLEETLAIAGQITEALETAHDRGIVHRDLKPANVKLTPEGEVKVLDFGLAKSVVPKASELELSSSPTLTAEMTRHGVLLGTAAYMSPEQARGQEAGQQADIWALGCVIYEMLTGHQTFARRTVSDTIAAILTEEPDWRALPRSAPPSLCRLLRRCLAKDPRQRLHSAADARLELDEALAAPAAEIDTARTGDGSRRRLLLAVAASVTVTALVVWAAGRVALPPPAPSLPRTFELIRGVGVEPTSVYSGLNRLDPRVSPDGSMVLFPSRDAEGAYDNTASLWIRDLDRLDPRPLEGTEGVRDAFWSPDSNSIGYATETELRRVSARGGPSVVLASFGEFFLGGTWGRDDRIVIALAARGLFEIAAGGGELRRYLAPETDQGDFDFHSPTFLGDGTTLAFVLHPQNLVIDTIEIYDGRERRVVHRAPAGSQVTGIAHDPSARQLLFATIQANPGLWAVALDLEARATHGEARLVVPHGLAPSVTDDGLLVYVEGLRFVPERLVRVDRAGTAKGEVGQALWDIRGPSISPDGKRVAVRARHGGAADLWVHDLERETALRVTNDPDGEAGHAWADGGESLIYASGFGETSRLLRRGADGTGETTTLLEQALTAPSLPLDGSVVVYQVGGAAARRGPGDIWWFPAGRPEAAEPLVATPANEVQPAISPDGSRLAYTSDESGLQEVYLQPLPRGDRVRVSTRGGQMPAWSPRGDELFYVEGTTLMGVRVEPGSGALGAPTRLFSGAEVSSPLFLAGARMFAIGPGDDFLVVQRRLPGNPSVVAIQNWTELPGDR